MNPTNQLEDFIRQHGEELLRLAYTYVKSRHVAEDVVQDVLIKAFEKPEAFRGDSQYRTYLYRMTINQCKDYLKSWQYRKTIITDTLRNRTAATQRIGPDDEQILGQQILALPVHFREVLVLYYYKELNTREIGELLLIPENTVKTRLQRGRKQLKLNLERGGYDARYFYQNEY
ncbi:sigma-70 family RNA polymerase sigma factor [Chryseomicrobium palamuruense]|uniref:Sigma-70 family RNA polymerase sigma factor n=1 Tax=Chryseomicrobium palamuruense TaxID=682973 RepID=A0ABV8V0V7_9BACL